MVPALLVELRRSLFAAILLPFVRASLVLHVPELTRLSERLLGLLLSLVLGPSGRDGVEAPARVGGQRELVAETRSHLVSINLSASHPANPAMSSLASWWLEKLPNVSGSSSGKTVCAPGRLAVGSLMLLVCPHGRERGSTGDSLVSHRALMVHLLVGVLLRALVVIKEAHCGRI